MIADDQLPQHRCANPQCKVAESGRCLEGLALDKCPTYGRDLETENTAIDSLDEGPEQSVVDLRPATSLGLSEASDVLGRQVCRVIAVLGPREAGKTSLIASLFDLFQEGPVADISFAGSKTLHAFELACHDSRAASRRTAPTQERTGHGDVRFYHLDIAQASKRDELTLLIGDRAGEEYRTAADDIAHAGPFPEVTRADTVTVLVDGRRLLDDSARHNTRSEIGLMLRAMVEGGFFERSPHLIFALTKMDLVQAAEQKDRALADFQKVVDRATPIVSPCTQSISAVYVAAAPETAAIARGTGVDELLTLWTSPVAPPVYQAAERVRSERTILNLQTPSEARGSGK